MTQRIRAVYEHGVLRPLEPLELAEREQVSLTIQGGASGDWIDEDALRFAEKEGDLEVPIEEVRRRLQSITGSLADTAINERGAY